MALTVAMMRQLLGESCKNKVRSVAISSDGKGAGLGSAAAKVVRVFQWQNVPPNGVPHLSNKNYSEMNILIHERNNVKAAEGVGVC